MPTCQGFGGQRVPVRAGEALACLSIGAAQQLTRRDSVSLNADRYVKHSTSEHSTRRCRSESCDPGLRGVQVPAAAEHGQPSAALLLDLLLRQRVPTQPCRQLS